MRAVTILTMLVLTAPAQAQKASDYELECEGASDVKWCNVQLAQFRKWFPLALRGDYQGQRNVAYCLSDGCDGAVMKKPITSCAWRIVIVGSGSPKVDQIDTNNLKNACGRLDETERQAAAAQAATLLAKIPRR